MKEELAASCENRPMSLLFSYIHIVEVFNYRLLPFNRQTDFLCVWTAQRETNDYMKGSRVNVESASSVLLCRFDMKRVLAMIVNSFERAQWKQWESCSFR